MALYWTFGYTLFYIINTNILPLPTLNSELKDLSNKTLTFVLVSVWLNLHIVLRNYSFEQFLNTEIEYKSIKGFGRIHCHGVDVVPTLFVMSDNLFKTPVADEQLLYSRKLYCQELSSTLSWTIGNKQHQTVSSNTDDFMSGL